MGHPILSLPISYFVALASILVSILVYIYIYSIYIYIHTKVLRSKGVAEIQNKRYEMLQLAKTQWEQTIFRGGGGGGGAKCPPQTP